MLRKKPYIFFVASILLLTSSLLASREPVSAVNADSVIAATNQVRITAGLRPLLVSPLLQSASEEKALDMAAKKYFAHNSPQGIKPWYWIEKNRYNFALAGENLAINYTDPRELLAAWLSSPEHKKNLLNPDYKDIGVGVRTFSYQGRNYTIVVQMFGEPQVLSMK